MTPRAATEADTAALLAFLWPRAAQAMFPLANLTGRGLPMQAWLAGGAGDVQGMLGLARGGMLLPCWPGLTAAQGAVLRAQLAGRNLCGAIGPADQVPGLLAALGLAAAPRRHDAVEPGFALDLDQLRLPASPGLSLAPVQADADTARAHRAAYLAEVFATPPDEAAETAARDVAGSVDRDSHVLLQRDGQTVAMAGFNADLGSVAQVGGVHVPPALRGQGLGRAVVGPLLDRARGRGLPRAVLFAASAAAARVCLALGFRPAGEMAVVLFAASPRVPPCR